MARHLVATGEATSNQSIPLPKIAVGPLATARIPIAALSALLTAIQTLARDLSTKVNGILTIGASMTVAATPRGKVEEMRDQITTRTHAPMTAVVTQRGKVQQVLGQATMRKHGIATKALNSVIGIRARVTNGATPSVVTDHHSAIIAHRATLSVVIGHLATGSSLIHKTHAGRVARRNATTILADHKTLPGTLHKTSYLRAITSALTDTMLNVVPRIAHCRIALASPGSRPKIAASPVYPMGMSSKGRVQRNARIQSSGQTFRMTPKPWLTRLLHHLPKTRPRTRQVENLQIR